LEGQLESNIKICDNGSFLVRNSGTGIIQYIVVYKSVGRCGFTTAKKTLILSIPLILF